MPVQCRFKSGQLHQAHMLWYIYADMKRVLSGMQPSGSPHLGNYLGAMRQHVEFSKNPNYECFYFIADLHALTTVRDGDTLRKLSHELALDYLALGLDTDRTVFFRQSDVPEVTELAWILDCVAPMGLLERAHAWKDARAESPVGTKGKKEATVGLFNYPVLMAADILIYGSDIVPVGQDQKQHVEIARDLAGKFNQNYGETFILPEPLIKKDVAVVPGTDGQKMSKSYGNTIDIFADAGTLKKQVMGIKTDSKGVSEPKDPKTCLPYLLYQHLASTQEQKDLESKLKEGGMGYAELKTILLEKLLGYFGEAREQRLELEKKRKYIEEILQNGGVRARKKAQETMEQVRKRIGLN